MPIQPHRDIANHAASVMVLVGKNPKSLLTSEYYNLSILAVMCGFPTARREEISTPDALEILKAALRSPAQGIMVTARVARSMGVTIEGATGVPDIFGTPEPAQPPMAPQPPQVTNPAPSGVTMEDVQRACRRVERTVADYTDNACGALLDTVTERFESFVSGVPEAIEEALARRTVTNLVITVPNAPPLPVGLVHYQTPRIIRALANGLNVYLHGPAGSGKTTTGKKAAEAFGLPFYTTAKVESEYLLLGFRNAQGETVRTPFRDAYEKGGVFLFDEMDASSPGAIVALNMALANGVCPFPDGLVARHPDFHCIGAGNTTLSGATRQYAGRNQLDAASVDRFYFIEFPYDEALEMELATNKTWCRHVQAIRGAVKSRGLNHLVTPRATFDGCKALAMGDTVAEAEMSCIFKGLDHETVDAIRRAVPRYQVPQPVL